jgi:AraC-like DNA-binding protein
MMKKTRDLFQEVSPLSPKDSFIIIERKKDHFDFPLHIHPEYELNYIENAKGTLRVVGDSIEEIENEEMVLITNPHLEHAWYDHKNHSDNIHEITIQFHPDLLSEELLSRNQLFTIRELFQQSKSGVAFNKETIRSIRPLLLALIEESEGFQALICLFELLYKLSMSNEIRRLSKENFANTTALPNTDDRLEKTIQYINAHFTEEIHLKNIAEALHMSEVSFSRYIKQHTSKNFVDFLTDIRLNHASRQLIDSDQSIADICYESGFNNLSNFNRAFKKRKECTPTEFRNNFRKNTIIF